MKLEIEISNQIFETKFFPAIKVIHWTARSPPSQKDSNNLYHYILREVICNYNVGCLQTKQHLRLIDHSLATSKYTFFEM